MKLLKNLFIGFMLLSACLHASEVDSLTVFGRIVLDGEGMENVSIAGVKTDSSGYYTAKIPAGIDTSFAPKYRAFLFSPESYEISALDTLLDSMNYVAYRQDRKVVVISGQSNAEHCGDLKYFIEDTVDTHIPYYLAYSGGEFGLSTLGLLTKFGMSRSYCDGYNHGFGLEILLARTLYNNFSDSLAILKAPYSGTSLYEDWKPDGTTWQWFVEKHENAEIAFREKGYEPKYVAFYWFQGESDETPQASSAYPRNLQNFVDRIRARFTNDSELDNLPFICVQINWNPDSNYEEPVRAAQRDLPNHRADCACVDVDDCKNYRYSSKNMHFSGGALNRIGFKMAAQYLEMLGRPIDSTVTVLVDMDEVLDTTIVLHCEGDTTFDHVMTDLEFEFPAKIGDTFTFSLNLGSETYNYAPSTRSTPFAYPQYALTDPSFSFNVNKVVSIKNYHETMDHVLLQSYPNPFNPLCNISFTVPECSHTSLNIYDIKGKCVAKLINEVYEQGAYELAWNAGNFSSGVYIVKLQVGEEHKTQKLMLLK